MLSTLLKRAFSVQSPGMGKLLSKVPKEVEVDVSPGFLTAIF